MLDWKSSLLKGILNPEKTVLEYKKIEEKI